LPPEEKIYHKDTKFTKITKKKKERERKDQCDDSIVSKYSDTMLLKLRALWDLAGGHHGKSQRTKLRR
jgi:hypothetical protein